MLEHVPAALGHVLRSIRPGLGAITYANSDLSAPQTLQVTSTAFQDGNPIPMRFTADGAMVSPPLGFADIPANARSLALIVEDADSPTPSPLCHALVWNIAAETGGLQEAAFNHDAMITARGGAVFGKNSFQSLGWLPPDPPNGHGPHRYAIQLYALDNEPDLEEGAGRSALIKALAGHVIAKGMMTGTYEREG